MEETYKPYKQYKKYKKYKSYKSRKKFYDNDYETQNMDIIKNSNITNNTLIIDIIQIMISWKLKMDEAIYDKCPFRHLATFLYDHQKNYNNYIISENSLRELRNGCCYGSHAEMSAMRKLPPLKFRGRRQIINLVVIRIDKKGVLKNSAPCFMCIKHMEWINNHTSYKINNVYYSHGDGIIIVKKLDDLIVSTDKHVSRRFKKQLK